MWSLQNLGITILLGLLGGLLACKATWTTFGSIQRNPRSSAGVPLSSIGHMPSDTWWKFSSVVSLRHMSAFC